MGRVRRADLSNDSRSLAFCLHGASQDDDDIYVMINAYWEKLEFHVQEGAAQEWTRIVDTALPSPDDFPDRGEPLEASGELHGGPEIGSCAAEKKVAPTSHRAVPRGV